MPGTEALFAALQRSGWRLTYSNRENAWLEYYQNRTKNTDRRWSIGLIADENGLIGDLVEYRAAANAAAGPGMTLVAVNGRKYSPGVQDSAIVQAQQARKPIELLVLNNDFYRTLEVAYFDGPRFPHLTRIDGATDRLTAVLRPRAAAP